MFDLNPADLKIRFSFFQVGSEAAPQKRFSLVLLFTLCFKSSSCWFMQMQPRSKWCTIFQDWSFLSYYCLVEACCVVAQFVCAEWIIHYGWAGWVRLLSSVNRAGWIQASSSFMLLLQFSVAFAFNTIFWHKPWCIGGRNSPVNKGKLGFKEFSQLFSLEDSESSYFLCGWPKNLFFVQILISFPHQKLVWNSLVF